MSKTEWTDEPPRDEPSEQRRNVIPGFEALFALPRKPRTVEKDLEFLQDHLQDVALTQKQADKYKLLMMGKWVQQGPWEEQAVIALDAMLNQAVERYKGRRRFKTIKVEGSIEALSVSWSGERGGNDGDGRKPTK